jgi:hypothetical protein
MNNSLPVSIFHFLFSIFSPMLRLGLAAALALLGATTVHAQLGGQISTAKDAYLAGEPIYVHFEVTNTGKDPVEYVAADPYAEGCGGHDLQVSLGPPLAHPSCAPPRADACDSSDQILAPGETIRQNILVNFAHDVTGPGDYDIHAVRRLPYRIMNGSPSREQAEFKLEKDLHIHVQKGDRDTLRAIYQVYVRNLDSPDDEIQRDAERAIVSGAMPWLEDTVVGMVRQNRSREFALLGLRNLNTSRARDELFKIVQNTSEFTPENDMAVGYLAQTGDKKYFPALLEMVKRQPPDQARDYVLAVAELGGDDAVAYLKELAASKDHNAQANGVTGLGLTGSRAAVPLLINTLRSENRDRAKLAENALAVLTHRRVGVEGDAPSEQAPKWLSWWTAEGSTARLYGPRECGEVETLP